jgi:hypothetical protein
VSSVLRNIVSDNEDCISSKRVVTLLAFSLCAAGFVADLFWDLKVNTAIYESMMYIVISGLGFTASEKFAPSRGKRNE